MYPKNETIIQKSNVLPTFDPSTRLLTQVDEAQSILALSAFLHPRSVKMYPLGHWNWHFPLTHSADANGSNAVQSSPSPESLQPPQLKRSDEISTHSYQFRFRSPLPLVTGHDLCPGGQTIAIWVCIARLPYPPPPPPPMLPVGVGVQVA